MCENPRRATGVAKVPRWLWVLVLWGWIRPRPRWTPAPVPPPDLDRLRTTEHLPESQVGHLSVTDIGRVTAGAGWFGADRAQRWSRRHVETLSFLTHDMVRRALTCDLVLPDTTAWSVPWRDGERMYYCPVAAIRKTPPTANIDLRNEEGRKMPLLNRPENAAISAVALAHALKQLLDVEVLSDSQLNLIRILLRAEPETALVAAALLRAYVRRETPSSRSHHVQQMADLLASLAVNSVIWLRLVGVPHQRRIIQLSYDLRVRQPRIPRPRRPETLLVEFRGRAPVEEPVEEDDDAHRRGNLRRLFDRAGKFFGLSAYHVSIHPYTANTDSYHLQAVAPPGMETRAVRLGGRLRNARGDPVRPQEHVTPGTAHLSFFGAQVVKPGPITLSLRVPRRGYMSWAAATCLLISLMLWGFDQYQAQVSAPTSHDFAAAVAVLLIVPAVLTSLLGRQGEHALLSWLLSGPRFCVLLAGACAALDAAVLVGITPFGSDTKSMFHYTAIASAIVAGFVCLMWVEALAVTDRARYRALDLFSVYGRFWSACALSAVAAVVVLTQMPTHAGHRAANLVWAVGALITAAVGAVGASLAEGPEQRGYAERTGLLTGLTAAAMLATIPLSLFAHSGALSWEHVRPWLLLLLVLLASNILLLEGWRRTRPPRAPAETWPPRINTPIAGADLDDDTWSTASGVPESAVRAAR